MPELPELEGLARWLGSQLHGRTITALRLRSLAALKTYDPPLASLQGCPVDGVSRRGKYLGIRAGDKVLAVHLSRGGWMRWSDVTRSRKPSQRGPIVCEIEFDQGMLDITEHGKEKRLALWVVDALEAVPQVAGLGPEALAGDLESGPFADLIRSRSGTLKSVLADQHVIAGIGNAYSDEILHAARLSPFTRTVRLDDDQLNRLFQSTKHVLNEAVARAVSLEGKDLKDDKRSHFRVHGRTGEPCPACGDTIRAVWLGDRSFQYCPNCQTEGRVYADRRLSRLIK